MIKFWKKPLIADLFLLYRFIIVVVLKKNSKIAFGLVYFMSCLKTAAFRKSANCPLSKDLLAYQTGEIQARERERISIHLRFCEFCEAEIEFYAHYPQSDEAIEKTDIPQPLLELAEALLNNQHKDKSVLNKLLNEADELQLQKR